MPSWMDRSAREWLAEGPSAGPAAPAVAALAGALGASRVLRTFERAKAAGSAPGFDAVIGELTALRAHLESLADRIDDAFRPVGAVAESAATAAELRAASDDLLAAFDGCFAVLEVAQQAVGSLDADGVADLWVGAGLVAAALEALAISVRSCLPRIADEAYTRPTKSRVVSSLHEARRARERILQAVESRLVL